MVVKVPNNPFVLIDGTSYLYRAYHAFPFLCNRKGQATGAMYGVLNMLRRLILRYRPTHAAVVFDMQEKTFRHKLFKHYKSHRPIMPDSLREQINPLYAMVKTMGLPLITVSGVEADDVIGTLARKAERAGYFVLISTNDKDIAQLVTSKVIIVNTITNSVLDIEGVINKYGVSPHLIIDFLALVGDVSDNIPGVVGIGKKTAKILLKEFGNLNTVYAKSEKIANMNFRGAKTIAKKLKENKEIAYLSYQLAKIKTDVILELTYEQLKIKEPYTKALLELFKQYDFKCWIKDIISERWMYSELCKSANRSINISKYYR